MSEKKTKRILIIGAVAAGTSAAAKARRNDPEAEIVIYEMDSDISYAGCALPYYIGGKVENMDVLTPRNPAFFKEKYKVDILIKHEVTSINPNDHSIRVKNLTTEDTFTDYYDKLVISTGAKSIMPPLPGIDLPHVFSLRNPSDARALRTFIREQKPAKAVVVGSGFIGLEMVENLAENNIKIDLVEKLQEVCPFVDPDMSVHVHKYLEKKDISIYTGTAVSGIDSEQVTLTNGKKIAAELVIMAVGIKPNIALAAQAGIVIGPSGAIAVDENLQTNIDNIFACGDCAETYFLLDGRPMYRPLGSTANKTGRIVGEQISGGGQTFPGIMGTGIFRLFSMQIAACGLSQLEAEESGYEIAVLKDTKPDKPKYLGGKEFITKAIADKKTGKILGVQIIGYAGVDKRMDVYVTAMTAGLGIRDLPHLDLAYAPPFSTARDPVHYVGMIMENMIY